MSEKTRLQTIAADLAKTMRCNCDLDNWEPERSTGHSHVCRIHKEALLLQNKILPEAKP